MTFLGEKPLITCQEDVTVDFFRNEIDIYFFIPFHWFVETVSVHRILIEFQLKK